MAETDPKLDPALNLNLLAEHVSLDAPHYKNSRFYNFKDFDQLFPVSVSHADQFEAHTSALSQSAYFVDLVRFLEEHIPNNSLKIRRPDLWEIPLDREHTETQVSFLDIVNTAMRAHLSDNPPDGSDEQKQRARKQSARKQLAGAQHPFDMPFHSPLLKIRTYLAHFAVALADVYKTFRAGEVGEAWVAEVLGLSPVEYANLMEASTPINPIKSYGLPKNTPDPLILLADVNNFLAQTGLQPNELDELLGLQLVFSSASKPLQIAPPPDDQELPAAPARFANLDIEKLDYLNSFIRISQRLGWSFSELDLALRSLKTGLALTDDKQQTFSGLARLKHLSGKYQLSVEELCSFQHDMNTRPVKPAVKSLFDQVFNTTPFYHSEGEQDLNYHPRGFYYPDSQTTPLSWDGTPADGQDPQSAARNKGIRSSLLASLNCSNEDLQSIVNHLCHKHINSPLDPKNILLDVCGLTRFYRIARMAQILGMKVPEYLQFLTGISGVANRQLETPQVSNLDDFQIVAYWADWLKETGLNSYHLNYLTSGLPGTDTPDTAVIQDALSAILKPWLVRPQHFAQGLIRSDQALAVYTALNQAGLIDDLTALRAKDDAQKTGEDNNCIGLVKSRQSAPLTHNDVIAALASAPEEALQNLIGFNQHDQQALLPHEFTTASIISLACTKYSGNLYIISRDGKIFSRSMADEAAPWRSILISDAMQAAGITSLAVGENSGAGDILFAGTNNHGVFWCAPMEEADAIWYPLHSPEWAGLTITTLALTEVDGEQTLFASTDTGQVFSRTVADIFMRMEEDERDYPLHHFNPVGMQAAKITTITVMNGDVLWALTEDGSILYCTDLGSPQGSWAQLDGPLIKEKITSLAVTPDNQILFASTDQGHVLFYSASYDTWRSLHFEEFKDAELITILAHMQDSPILFAGTLTGLAHIEFANHFNSQTPPESKTILFPNPRLEINTSILEQLQPGILTDNMQFALDPMDQTLFQPPFDLSFLLPGMPEPQRGLLVAALRDLLVARLDAIHTITATLNQLLARQDRALVIKQLAGSFDQDPRFIDSALAFLNPARSGLSEVVKPGGLENIAILLYLARMLGLTAAEFDSILNNPASFSLKPAQSKIRFRFDTLRAAHEFSLLVRSFEKNGALGEKTAAALAALAPKVQLKTDLAEVDRSTLSQISGWEKDQLGALLDHFKQLTGGEKYPRDKFSALTVIQECFDLTGKIGANVETFIGLCDLATDHSGDIFERYTSAARSLLRVVKARYSAAEWADIYDPIHDLLNERERDALAKLLLRHSRDTIPANAELPWKFDSLQNLSEYLLIDVEMSGCARTSHIAEAIGCLQIYIERCRMHFEPGINLAPDRIPDQLWNWMGHYRLWEANRKVFFYPENYLAPGQRKQATPLFQELQSELLQGDITDEAVAEAYINYFDKLDELASLQVVDGHLTAVKNPATGADDETLFIVARTSSTPPIFFYRSAVLDRVNQRFTAWRPWQKIELTIPVRVVKLHYAFNRLYIYWIETATTSEKQDGTNDKKITTQATVKYSYQKVSARWLQPQTHPQADKLHFTINPLQNFPAAVLPIPVGQPGSNLILRGTVDVHQVGQWSIDLQPSYWKDDAPHTASPVAEARSRKMLAPDFVANVKDVQLFSGAETVKHSSVLIVTPDGRTLFAGTASQGVFRLDLAGTAGASWQPWSFGLENPVNSIEVFYKILNFTVAPDGQTLFAGTNKSGVYRCQIDSHEPKWEPLDASSGGKIVRGLVIAPDGSNLYAGTDFGVFYYRLGTGGNTQWLSLPRNENGKPNPIRDISALAISPDGRNLFVGTLHKGVYRCSIDNGIHGEWESLDKEWDPGLSAAWDSKIEVKFLAVTADSRTLVAGTNDQPILHWDIQDGSDIGWEKLGFDIRYWDTPNYYVDALVAAPVGRTLFASIFQYGSNAMYRIIDPTAWSVDVDHYHWGIDLGRDRINSFAITPDGRTLFIVVSGKGIYRGVTSLTSLVSFANDNDSYEFVLRSPVYPGKSTVHHDDKPAPKIEYTCQRLTTDAVHKLRQKLVTGGIESLLSLAVQRLCQPPANPPIPGALLDGNNLSEKELLDPQDFDLSDPYAIYYREIFFHIPFLIADALQRNQQFAHAQKWYQYILDPTRPEPKGTQELTDSMGIWRYLPFRGHSPQKLFRILHDPAHHADLEQDAFDPDGIAQMRLGAYEKALAMRYLDNLLDWGDMLFAQDTAEDINQAVQLYVRALNLIGPKPKPQWVPLPKTSMAHNAGQLTGAPAHQASHPDLQALLDDANRSANAQTPWRKNPFFDVPTYFCLPENDAFAEYWDRAQTCLFKIRNCMNIAGVVRQLALFQPPIDLQQLIRTQAAGQDLALSTQAPLVPHYRFSVMLQHARNLTSSVMQFGAALLSALEKKDAEDLQLIRSSHERTILKLTRQIKDKQIEDAEYNLDALNKSLDSAQYRQGYYRDLIQVDLSPNERESLALLDQGLDEQILAHVVRFEAVIGHLIPTIYGFADGGFQPGASISEAATLSDALAGIAGQQSARAVTIGQYARREEDWHLQEALSGFDLLQIKSHIESARVHLEITKQESALHEKTIQHADEIEQFLTTRFTNKQLWQWMIGRLALVYFQSYKLAFELARSAELAYKYERHTDESFLDFGYWDSLRKGLLAGEGLMLGLDQIEKAYLDGDARALEIEKTISLGQLSWEQLDNLKLNGKCAFNFSEQLFDQDFPGHYCRLVKSVSISIPAVVGPYQNIKASLTQTSNRVLLKPDLNAVQALLSGVDLDKVDSGVLRSNWRADQQIAISKGIDDSGLFQLDFRDERYLPFEATGAISGWELSLPKATNHIDFNSISDVIIHLRYTALDGGAKFRGEVVKLDKIRTYSGTRLISLRQEFAADWNAAKQAKKTSQEFKLPESLFPSNLMDIALSEASMWVFRNNKQAGVEKPQLRIEALPATDTRVPLKQWSIAVQENFGSDALDGADTLNDIVLIIPYTAELPW